MLNDSVPDDRIYMLNPNQFSGRPTMVVLDDIETPENRPVPNTAPEHSLFDWQRWLEEVYTETSLIGETNDAETE